MNDQQINQTIAKACGWTEIHDSGPWHHHKPWGYPPQPPGAGGNAYKYVPDYCNDLNAMYEAEEQMDEIDWVFFMTELAGLVRLPKQAEVQIKQLLHATARQRAKAFLRTLGKWEEAQ